MVGRGVGRSVGVGVGMIVGAGVNVGAGVGAGVGIIIGEGEGDGIGVSTTFSVDTTELSEGVIGIVGGITNCDELADFSVCCGVVFGALLAEEPVRIKLQIKARIPSLRTCFLFANVLNLTIFESNAGLNKPITIDTGKASKRRDPINVAIVNHIRIYMNIYT